jgi:hypothetical protein
MLEAEEAEKVLGYLGTYGYASPQHVTLSLLWPTMLRRGAADGPGVDDYHTKDQCLEVLQRPETDTPIINSKRCERG